MLLLGSKSYNYIYKYKGGRRKIFEPLLGYENCNLWSRLPSIAEIVGWEHTIGCVVEWGATLSNPGECILTSSPDSLSFYRG